MKNEVVKNRAKPFAGIVTLFHLFLDDEPAEEFSGLDAHITKEPKSEEDIENARIAQILKEHLLSMQNRENGLGDEGVKKINKLRINKGKTVIIQNEKISNDKGENTIIRN